MKRILAIILAILFITVCSYLSIRYGSNILKDLGDALVTAVYKGG